MGIEQVSKLIWMVGVREENYRWENFSKIRVNPVFPFTWYMSQPSCGLYNDGFESDIVLIEILTPLPWFLQKAVGIYQKH